MYRIRNYNRTDLEKLRDLYVRAGENSLWGPVAGGRQFDMLLQRPQSSPEADLFIAESKGERLVAYADVRREVRIGRVVVDIYVHPRFRRLGIGRRLVEGMCERASALGAQNVHVLVGDSNTGGLEFLDKAGFEPVRRYLVLAREEGRERRNESGVDFGNLVLGHFQGGDEQRLADIQNLCFEGSWGFCPNTADEIGFYLAMTMTRIQDVMVLRDDAEVVGYLWPQILERNKGGGGAHGWIHMVGVRPDYRGQGLGKKLVQTGLQSLRERGVQDVELTVDEENRQAVTLYASLGFSTKDTKLWYELPLP
ncbi:MAG: GNAT family N-acetyltransferase [Candidatus Aminicenantaceae bacterium]